MSSDSGETTVVRSIGRYRVFGELGRGAMGVVYKGFDPLIGRTVALKTLSIDNTNTQAREFRERLYREAAAAGALSHPNIVTIYDIIEDGGVTAVAMEFIEGRPLSAIIAERAPLPIDLAAELLDQMCSALDYAGSQGIVHRDIKPANILVTTAGRAKVTDFGVARLALSTMTQAGTVLGSPSYMSPEQVKGLSLDGRSDLFSAAVVFFEMITRERPFAGNDIATTMYRIAHEAPTPPTEFNPEVGPGVTAVLERAFAKSPADRYQAGADLVADLKAAASLGARRVSSLALAAFATAPPAVPPIVAPMVTLQATSAADSAIAPAEAAPIPVTRAAASSSSGSQGLAPIPEAVLSAGPAAGPVASGVDLPVIPLPPEPAAVPVPTASAPAKPQARAKPASQVRERESPRSADRRDCRARRRSGHRGRALRSRRGGRGGRGTRGERRRTAGSAFAGTGWRGGDPRGPASRGAADCAARAAAGRHGSRARVSRTDRAGTWSAAVEAGSEAAADAPTPVAGIRSGCRPGPSRARRATVFGAGTGTRLPVERSGLETRGPHTGGAGVSGRGGAPEGPGRGRAAGSRGRGRPAANDQGPAPCAHVRGAR